MDRKTREELNRLSKEVFGTSSRWKKIVDKGTVEPLERDRKVIVPKANGQLVEKVFTDKKGVTKYMTVEEVLKLMLEIQDSRKKQIAAFQEALAKKEEPKTQE
jgi:hypothetical protein